MASATDDPDSAIEIDLEKQTITRGNKFRFEFDIDPFRKACLLNGLDDIGLTLEKNVHIDTFEEKRSKEQPWV
jgi:3-isopropylmalate/(R)-2-methylmalate dehydratase small subunit